MGLKPRLVLTCNGRTQPLKDWAIELEMSYQTLFQRIYAYGWSVERALTTPVGHRPVTYAGVTCSVAEWSRVTGIPYPTLYRRLSRGWNVGVALTTPVRTKENQKEEVI